MAIKKSQISTQFAWIFILIAGAIILIFFISLVYKQKAISEQKLASDVQVQLKSILLGAGLSPGTSKQIETPNAEIDFTCDEEGFSAYSVKGALQKEEIPMQVLFAPNIIKGDKLIAWALEWDAPFKVTNFLYLSSPKVKYVFVSPPEDVEKDFPEDFSKETVNDVSAVSAEGADKIRFVFFNKEPVFPSQLNPKKVDISAINIASGQIYFYKAGKNSFAKVGEIPYLDMPSLYGAIFSDDLAFYECDMKKAFKRLNFISQIYSERQDELKSYGTGCGLYYIAPIQNLVSDSGQCSTDIRGCMGKIAFDVGAIKSQQEILIIKSCPLLY